MKVFKDNKVYVERNDLEKYCFNLGVLTRITSPKLMKSAVDVLPGEVYDKYEDEGKFVEFSSEEAIDYFKERVDILDYNRISKMSEKELINEYDIVCDKEMELLSKIKDSKSRKERTELEAQKELIKLQLANLFTYHDEKPKYDRMIKRYFKSSQQRTCKNIK